MNTPGQQACARRRFIKLFFLFTAGAAFGRERWAATALADVQPQTGAEGGLLRLKLTDFPVLRQDFGSVRIGSSPVAGNHYPTGLFSPVIITRAPGNRFYALDAACTHEGCTVPILDPESGVMQCPCHGSQYLIDGSVQRGPANLALRQFSTRFDGIDSLAISLPDVSYALEVFQVQRGSGRLQLNFIAFEQIEYELRFRPGPGAEWSGPVPFALTSDGPADRTVVVGQANIASVFVDASGQGGFYAVLMRVQPV